MPATTTLRRLESSEALALVDEGAAFVDLRPLQDYLDVHIKGSIELFYEFGPGMAARARDCLPLEVPLVIVDLGHGDPGHAAASLRGKGFTVLGRLSDAINAWAAVHGTPASTDQVRGREPPQGLVLDVGDPGARPVEGALKIPVERLWAKGPELASEPRVVLPAGYGVRAALAVGILERFGVGQVLFWKP